uniref:Uncharacterized protein n=1 Tax=Anopheles atroparvus TaxID=41427 RepID=A0AAG5D2A8_ANOAO
MRRVYVSVRSSAILDKDESDVITETPKVRNGEI